MKSQLTPEIIAASMLIATIGIVMAISTLKWLNKMFKE